MDIKFMRAALREAEKAEILDETPVGAVIVRDGKIIARGGNRRETKKNALMHAEIIAIDKACKKTPPPPLDDCEMFVSLEPCPMCAGAILNARLKKVSILCLDNNHGAVMSKYHLLNDNVLNHTTQVEYIENLEAKNLIQLFFKMIRKK